MPLTTIWLYEGWQFGCCGPALTVDEVVELDVVVGAVDLPDVDTRGVVGWIELHEDLGTSRARRVEATVTRLWSVRRGESGDIHLIRTMVGVPSDDYLVELNLSGGDKVLDVLTRPSTT